MEPIPTKSFDEKEWVVRIIRTLDEELQEEMDTPVSIFTVPKPLLRSNPHSYVPQQVAIGPYNVNTPQHYEMDRYKIAAAKRILQSQSNIGIKFRELVEQFQIHDQRIRAGYQRYLDLDSDTLACIMALDACFLLEFLSVYADRGGNYARVPSTMSRFIDSAGSKSAHNAILRDVVMLENQIPLFSLRTVLEFQHSSNELLGSVLIGFCNEISPFKGRADGLEDVQSLVKKCAHLLDFLYRTIVTKFEGPSNVLVDKAEIVYDQIQDDDAPKESDEKSFKPSSDVEKVADIIRKALAKAVAKPINRFLAFKPVRVIAKLPISMSCLWQMGTSSLQNNMEKDKAAAAAGAGGTFEMLPLMEEIAIPSVTELLRARVKFVPTYTGIYSIKFDAKTATFYLPMISLNVNSGIILRNLVAYEACSAPGPLVFTRYTELMNGIIDTDEDVKILRKNGIIVNHLKSDKGVTKLWNGMSRSIRLTKVDFLDQTIAEVNRYYKGRWNIRANKFVDRYVYESWKMLTLLATLLLLFLTGVQAFCSVYSCPAIVKTLQAS